MSAGREQRAAVLDKWQRIEDFWAWTGRTETGADLVSCFRSRSIYDTLQKTFAAQQAVQEHAASSDEAAGLRKGAARMQARTAWKIVGTVFGFSYGRDVIQEEGPGAFARPDLASWLRELSPQRRREVAEMWVGYLRDGVNAPGPWQPAPLQIESAVVQTPEAVSEGATELQHSTEAARRMDPEPIFVESSSVPSSSARVHWKRRALLGSIAFVCVVGLGAFVIGSPSAGDSTLDVQVQAERAGSRFIVDEGSELYSGDELTLQVSSTEPGYMQLLWLSAEGEVFWLYPDTGSPQAFVPGQIYRIPNDGAVRLDDVPGSERLLLLLTNRPLRPGQDNLLQSLRTPEMRDSWPPEWPAFEALRLAPPAAPAAGQGGTAASEAAGAVGSGSYHVLHRGVRFEPSTQRAAAISTIAAYFLTVTHAE